MLVEYSFSSEKNAMMPLTPAITECRHSYVCFSLSEEKKFWEVPWRTALLKKNSAEWMNAAVTTRTVRLYTRTNAIKAEYERNVENPLVPYLLE